VNTSKAPTINGRYELTYSPTALVNCCTVQKLQATHVLVSQNTIKELASNREVFLRTQVTQQKDIFITTTLRDIVYVLYCIQHIKSRNSSRLVTFNDLVIWVCFGYSGGHGEGSRITAASLLRVNWWIRKFDFNLLLLTLDRFRLSCASIRTVIWSWVFRIFVDNVNN
jgi:hypothetical protein